MIYTGIDISKDFFDVAIPKTKGYQSHQYENQMAGFEALLAVMPPNAHCVMEATGPYYLRLATYLYQQGIPVSVVNPLVIGPQTRVSTGVKRFSQMKLSRAKTDKADAKLIADYGHLHQPQAWHPPVAFIEQVGQEQSLLAQLIKQRTAFQNHRHALLQHPHPSEKALQSLETLLEQLDEQIKELEESIAQQSQAHCAPLLEVLTSIPGIGPKTAIHLLVITRCFERFENSKQLSAYIGLAPRLYQSGSSVRGKVHIAKLGMAKMRSLLYMCAWTASQHNQACKELYQRLLAKGKAKKLALIAVANKLLKQAFAIATTLTPYRATQSKQNLGLA